ncbi:hypothetical protein EV401DRAFT_568045 [Pisolithus croceorrhizus]|nr:hypothetical protein EV401DRAFT_568045 [Pisolithus croceorrhizus]
MNVTTPLSKAQERKVVQYVEDAFMDITSAYKKRSEPSMTKLPTLSSYLYAMQSLLAFILRIPSVDSSTPLRTTFLFRFVPVILILKGNFEINLSVRFGTVANMGRLNDPPNRRNIIYSNLALQSRQ